MSNKDLRNLYEGVRRGDEYVAPSNIKDLYSHVLREKYTISYRDESGTDVFEGEVSDTQMMNIKKWIDVSDDAAEQVKAALIRSQFTEEQAEEIMSIVLRHEDPGGFLTAINAENGKLSIQEFLDNGENILAIQVHNIDLNSSIKFQGNTRIESTCLSNKSFEVIIGICDPGKNFPCLLLALSATALIRSFLTPAKLSSVFPFAAAP